MKEIYDRLFSCYNNTNNPSNLYSMIEELKEKILTLEDNYKNALLDIRRLEEENIETTNVLYELSNSLDAIDARIDILHIENHLEEKK